MNTTWTIYRKDNSDCLKKANPNHLKKRQLLNVYRKDNSDCLGRQLVPSIKRDQTIKKPNFEKVKKFYTVL